MKEANIAVNLNECQLSGTVMETPNIVGEGDNRWAFVKLITTFGLRNPDGSYSDIEQPIQIVTDDQRHVKTIENYVKAGKAVTFFTYYREWDAQGQKNHGFFIRKMVFASANWGQENNNFNNGGAPGLPA